MNNNSIDEKQRIIAIWGYPDPKSIDNAIKQYPNNKIVDLDIPQGVPSSAILPDAYCRIMRNIIDNAIALKDRIDVVVASVGEEKCDSGRFAAKILKDMGFNVIETNYNNSPFKNISTPISTSSMPLTDKINTIMDGIIKPVTCEFPQINAEFGFWGVPPNDLSFLELFPDSTHVYGWTRCVEAKRPADLELEMHVDKNVPTVFFAQTFCAKMQLAKYLAKKHNGLYIDIDDIATNSVRAKVEAFIELR